MKKIVGITVTILLVISAFIIIKNRNNNVDDINLGDKITNIYALEDADKICTEIGKNDKLKVGIYNSYDNEEYIVPSTSQCYGTSYYNSNLQDIKQGDDYVSWTTFGRIDSSKYVYIDDVIVKEPKKNGRYSYFYISNNAQSFSSTTGNLLKTATLKNGEKIFIDIDISDKNLMSDKNKDLRVSINYGYYSGDIKIDNYNSIAYYLYSEDGDEYGPYRMDTSSVVNQYTIGDKPGSANITEYKIVSKNLFDNLEEGISTINGVKIDKIKIVPYEFFAYRKGYFRLYNIDVNLYDSYNNNVEYVTVSNAENKTRHNVVDNMVRINTIKWDTSPLSRVKMEAYYTTSTGKILFDGTSDKVYYGMPYMTASSLKGTINSFVSKTSQNVSENNALYSYNVPEYYLIDTTTSKGNSITKDDMIGDELYVFTTNVNAASALETASQKHKDLKNTDKEFINNNGGYIIGVSCSTSATAASSKEIPYYGYISSYGYFYSNRVKILGGLSISYKEVEDALREEGIINRDIPMTDTLFNTYYASVMKSKYSSEQVYNAYSHVLPGDMVAHTGHVWVSMGMPYVECKDGVHTQQYTDGFCDGHDGINPRRSYIIVTSAGGSKYKFRGNPDDSAYKRYVFVKDTGWSYTLDPKYTDLNSIDEIYTNSNILSGNSINARYYFSELYSNDSPLDDTDDDLIEETNEVESQEINDSEYKIYLPFRFVDMDYIVQDKVEKPIAKYRLDRDYTNEERNNLLYDYLKTNKSLKGTFFTNYLIDGIRIEINNAKYYIYPNQTSVFSLYSSLPEEILNALSSLNYDEYNEVVISMDMGPNLNEVNNAMHADSEGYFEVLRITSPKELINESIESKDSNTVISNDKIDIKIPYNYVLTINEINKKIKITGESIIIKNASGDIITNNNAVLGTGSKIILENSEYTIIVNGDINKDGKISSLDYIAVRNHLMQNKIINSSDVAYKAADINNDNKVSALDYVRIRTIMMEG